MKFADRRHLIESSGIRKVFDLAARLKDPCNLSIGLPDYDVPDFVKDAAIDAIRAGKNRYTLTAGVPELRARVKNMYVSRGLNVDDVMIASGTSGGLFLCFIALLNPGDEVMFADPYFVMYEQVPRLVGAKPALVDTYPDFRLTREKLERAWTPRCRMLIINSPNNPTGVVYTREEMEMAARFCEEKDLILLSDEIYEDFSYDGEIVSPARFSDPARTIIISGLSKNVALTGWRVGWVAGPKDLIQALTEIQQYTFVCSPAPFQHAAIKGMDHDMTATRADYSHRRDVIYNGLRERGFEVVRPGGAFYIFPKAPIEDSDEFVRRAIEDNLLVIPGSVFSKRNTHFRISFASTEAQLNRGLSILEGLMAKV